MWLEILSCSTISQQPYYNLPRLFLQIKDYKRHILLTYRTCFVVNQGLKIEINYRYTFIPLVSSHHPFKNEACYTFIPLVSSITVFLVVFKTHVLNYSLDQHVLWVCLLPTLFSCGKFWLIMPKPFFPFGRVWKRGDFTLIFESL